MAHSRKLLVTCLLAGAVLLALTGIGAAQSQVTLTVTVVDQNGDPVSGVDVSATWDDGDGGPVNETTRSNGQALVDVPEGADVTLRIHDDEYVRNEPYVVEDASTREVTVPVSEAVVPTINVADSAGEPLADARVRLYRSGTFVTDQRTGDDGTVTTRPVEAGDYRVYVSKSGYVKNRSDVTFTSDGETTVQLSEGSVLLSFSVVDDHFDEPRPVRNASVAVDSVGTVQTLSGGEATVSVPVNDQYTIAVTKDGYETERRTLRVRESDQSVDVAIQRTPRIALEPANRRVVVGETVRLTVTDEYGEPVPNATVSRDGESVGQTDASGVVTAEVPAAGQVNFTATSDSLSAEASVEGIDPDATDTPTETGTPSPTATEVQTTEGQPELPISDDGPGFTVLPALVGALLAVLLARRR